jgi:O-methyltransferase
MIFSGYITLSTIRVISAIRSWCIALGLIREEVSYNFNFSGSGGRRTVLRSLQLAFVRLHVDKFSMKKKRTLADIKLSVMRRLRPWPFKMGVTSLWPGTILAYEPDRYSENLTKYQSEPGLVSKLDTRSFYSGNRRNNCGDGVRLNFLSLTCDELVKENIRGSVAELGVYKGNTAFLLAELARFFDTTAYLLDTYEGFPDEDLVGEGNPSLNYSDTSLESVRSLVGEKNVSFIKGRFPGTANAIPDAERFCLVNLDCDLYAPFSAALQYFYPRLLPGGFLIMHDYSSLHWPLVEKAVDEFFADKPERPILIPDKSGTAVVRKTVS